MRNSEEFIEVRQGPDIDLLSSPSFAADAWQNAMLLPLSPGPTPRARPVIPPPPSRPPPPPPPPHQKDAAGSGRRRDPPPVQAPPPGQGPMLVAKAPPASLGPPPSLGSQPPGLGPQFAAPASKQRLDPLAAPGSRQRLDPPAASLELCVIPTGQEMAQALGDGSAFRLAEPYLRHNVTDEQWCWVSIQFACVQRGEQVWREPNIDCHITLLYARLEGSAQETRLEALRQSISQMDAEHLEASGLFNSALAQPNYAWVDLHVHRSWHQVLHRLAHIIIAGDDARGRGFATKAAFHASFRTPRRTR